MKFFLGLLLVISNLAFSQKYVNTKPWKLTIVDGNTSRGIEGVNISVNKTRNFISNVNGSATIDAGNTYPIYSLTITCVGYKSISILPADLKLADTIKLFPSITSLEGVNIHSSTLKGTTAGDIKKEYNSHRVPNPQEEFVQYIPNDKGITGIITAIIYVLNDELKGIEMPFKVGLYTKNKADIFPGRKLITDSIIVYNTEKKKKVSVDISKYHIPFPENGVIVSFETLSPDYYKDSILDTKKPFGKRWYRKMPGIDMDLKQKDKYPTDYAKQNRQSPYSMVINTRDKWSADAVKFHSYLFADGNNLAITLKISQN